MKPQTPQMDGAEDPKRPLEPILRDVVTGLLRLSTEEQDRLNSYSQCDCPAALQELANYTNNPVGKPERTIQDVVGELFLIYQCQTHLQVLEFQTQIARLQKANIGLWKEMQTTHAKRDQAQGDLDLLRVKVRTAQQGAESRHEED